VQPLCLQARGRRQTFDASLDRSQIVRLPQDQVDCIEGGGVANTRSGVDRNCSTYGSADRYQMNAMAHTTMPTTMPVTPTVTMNQTT